MVFTGYIVDTPLVVDQFSERYMPQHGELLFFLSHLHMDHIVGLSNHFVRGKIYCSPVTAELLGLLFPRLQVNAIPMNEPRILPTKGGRDSVTVTLSNAKHCPGSCMFTFQGDFGTIVHTGDFRCSSMRHPPVNPVDRLYLDATFCRQNLVLPPRREAIKQIIDLIQVKQWRRVYLACDTLGTEHILQAVFECFKERVYVDPDKFDNRLMQLRDVLGYKHLLSSNPGARIHLAKSTEIQKLATHSKKNTSQLFIKPSTQWFVRKRSSSLLEKDMYGLHHVHFSMHADHVETTALGRQLKPLAVVLMHVAKSKKRKHRLLA
jgi:DNA cross-link repair 1B protein